MSAASKGIRKTEFILFIFVQNTFQIDTETTLLSSRVPAPKSSAANLAGVDEGDAIDNKT